MKNIKYIILLLIVLVPIKVNALISLDCPWQSKPGQEIICSIKSDYNVSSFETSLNLDPKVNYSGANEGTGFENKTSGRDFYYTSSEGGTNISSFKIFVPYAITANTSFTIVLSNIKYIFSSGSALKTQADLKATVQVNVETTTKVTTTKEKTTTTAGSSKTFTITLNPNNGTSKTSTVTCTATGSSCKINLSSVTKPTKTGFTFAGWGNQATCTDGNTSSYDADKNTTLYACWKSDSGENTTTTAPVNTGTKLLLKTLTVEGQELEFSKFKYDYELTVLFEIESLVIAAEPAKEDVKVEIDDASALALGDNNLAIKLSDNEGNLTTYVIKVKRLNEGETIRQISSDATLKSLTLGEYNINFVPTVTDYNLEVKSETTALNITPVVNEEHAAFTIEGNENLATGSTVKITVTAEDGVTTNTYNIHIEVNKGIKDYLKYIILGSILLLAIIVLVISNLSRKKKTNNTNKTVTTKAPAKKVPTATPTSVKVAPPKVPEPKNSIEVLDL